jgi:dihydropteroate synthase
MRSPVTRSASLLPAGSPRIVGIVTITADSFSDGGRGSVLVVADDPGQPQGPYPDETE